MVAELTSWGPRLQESTDGTTAYRPVVEWGKGTMGGSSPNTDKGPSSWREPPGSPGTPTDARNTNCRRTLLLPHMLLASGLSPKWWLSYFPSPLPAETWIPT